MPLSRALDYILHFSSFDMAHGYRTEVSEGSHAFCHPGSKCGLACGLKPFVDGYGRVACDAHHGSVLEHQSGESVEGVAAARERHVYAMAQPRR